MFFVEEARVPDDSTCSDGHKDPFRRATLEECNVNAEASNPTEAIWAYLHGELSDADRRSFEQAMASDPALRSCFEEASRMDRLLRSGVPSESEEAALDALAEQALAAWERDQSVASDPFAAAEPSAFSKRGWMRWFNRPVMGLAGLAAAALFVVALSPVFLKPEGARWSEPVFSPFALRGPALPVGGHALDAGSAKRCQAALMAAVKRAADASGVALPPDLDISFRLQELQGGTFSVSVQARLNRGASVGEWSGDYSSVDSFVKLVDASAERMVEAWTNFSGAEGGGKRP